MQYPPAREDDFSENIHGVKVADPYRWMENEKDPRLADWIAAENKLTRMYLDKIPVRRWIAGRLKELWRIDTAGAPNPRGGLYFTFDRKASQELSVLYVRRGLRGQKKVLIDQNKLSKAKTTVISKIRISKPDGRFIAYGLSKQGNDKSSLHVLDVKTGKNLKDFIPDSVYPALYGGMAWNPDGSGFWYSRRYDKAPRSEPKQNHKIYYHRLGDDFRKDELIFWREVGKHDIPGAMVSDDGRYLIISVTRTSGKIRSTDKYIKDLTDKNGRFRPVTVGKRAIFYGWVHRNRLYILTNHKAPNWKLMMVPLNQAHLGMKTWRTVIPESRAVINTICLVRDRLFVETMENVHSVLKMRDLDGKFISDIPLPTFGNLGTMNAEAEGKEMFFSFVSFLMPSRIYRFDLRTGKTTLFYKSKIDFNPKYFQTEQVWYRSKDGAKVPMFLIHKKGIRHDGKNPTILYGYGGYGSSALPNFNSTRLPFLECGGVYVIANIRGGGEFGEKWHLAGTKGKKQNVFNDFSAAAEWLIKNKYTNSDKLAAFGWSNGGLLMGATLAQRPNLFKAIVAGAPVMDMLRFHKFHGGANWITEYGNPDDEIDFRYLFKYSPYHRLKAMDYPATFVLTAEGDDRVHPMHAYKFIAKLQKLNKSAEPVLLRVEGKAGHGGAASISKEAEEYADIYGFIFEQLGMK